MKRVYMHRSNSCPDLAKMITVGAVFEPCLISSDMEREMFLMGKPGKMREDDEDGEAGTGNRSDATDSDNDSEDTEFGDMEEVDEGEWKESGEGAVEGEEEEESSEDEQEAEEVKEEEAPKADTRKRKRPQYEDWEGERQRTTDYYRDLVRRVRESNPRSSLLKAIGRVYRRRLRRLNARRQSLVLARKLSEAVDETDPRLTRPYVLTYHKSKDPSLPANPTANAVEEGMQLESMMRIGEDIGTFLGKKARGSKSAEPKPSEPKEKKLPMYGPKHKYPPFSKTRSWAKIIFGYIQRYSVMNHIELPSNESCMLSTAHDFCCYMAAILRLRHLVRESIDPVNTTERPRVAVLGCGAGASTVPVALAFSDVVAVDWNDVHCKAIRNNLNLILHDYYGLSPVRLDVFQEDFTEFVPEGVEYMIISPNWNLPVDDPYQDKVVCGLGKNMKEITIQGVIVNQFHHNPKLDTAVVHLPVTVNQQEIAGYLAERGLRCIFRPFMHPKSVLRVLRSVSKLQKDMPDVPATGSVEKDLAMDILSRVVEVMRDVRGEMNTYKMLPGFSKALLQRLRHELDSGKDVMQIVDEMAELREPLAQPMLLKSDDIKERYEMAGPGKGMTYNITKRYKHSIVLIVTRETPLETGNPFSDRKVNAISNAVSMQQLARVVSRGFASRSTSPMDDLRRISHILPISGAKQIGVIRGRMKTFYQLANPKNASLSGERKVRVRGILRDMADVEHSRVHGYKNDEAAKRQKIMHEIEEIDEEIEENRLVISTIGGKEERLKARLKRPREEGESPAQHDRKIKDITTTIATLEDEKGRLTAEQVSLKRNRDDLEEELFDEEGEGANKPVKRPIKPTDRDNDTKMNAQAPTPRVMDVSGIWLSGKRTRDTDLHTIMAETDGICGTFEKHMLASPMPISKANNTPSLALQRVERALQWARQGDFAKDAERLEGLQAKLKGITDDIQLAFNSQVASFETMPDMSKAEAVDFYRKKGIHAKKSGVRLTLSVFQRYRTQSVGEALAIAKVYLPMGVAMGPETVTGVSEALNGREDAMVAAGDAIVALTKMAREMEQLQNTNRHHTKRVKVLSDSMAGVMKSLTDHMEALDGHEKRLLSLLGSAENIEAFHKVLNAVVGREFIHNGFAWKDPVVQRDFARGMEIENSLQKHLRTVDYLVGIDFDVKRCKERLEALAPGSKPEDCVEALGYRILRRAYVRIYKDGLYDMLGDARASATAIGADISGTERTQAVVLNLSSMISWLDKYDINTAMTKIASLLTINDGIYNQKELDKLDEILDSSAVSEPVEDLFEGLRLHLESEGVRDMGFIVQCAEKALKVKERCNTLTDMDPSCEGDVSHAISAIDEIHGIANGMLSGTASDGDFTRCRESLRKALSVGKSQLSRLDAVGLLLADNMVKSTLPKQLKERVEVQRSTCESVFKTYVANYTNMYQLFDAYRCNASVLSNTPSGQDLKPLLVVYDDAAYEQSKVIASAADDLYHLMEDTLQRLQANRASTDWRDLVEDKTLTISK